MKYKTFHRTLKNCYDLYQEAVARDKTLSDFLGGGSEVMTDWWSKYIENTISILSNELNDENEVVDWLFWECLLSDNLMSFTVDGKTYDATIENVWRDLTGTLEDRELIRCFPICENKDVHISRLRR